MAETPSTMLPLGTPLPGGLLDDVVAGSRIELAQIAAGKKGLLVFFICNHCPFVVHIRKELVRVAHDTQARGLAVAAINSNDAEAYPQDAPPSMARLAKEEGWRFPFLFDPTQDVARSFQAVCTPESFLFDAAGKLVYRGQFDESSPSNGKPVTGRDVRAAVAALEKGVAPPSDQQPSVGCSIKWRRQTA